MHNGKTARYLVAQLTIARWCLDGATVSAGEAADRNLRKAWRAYETVQDTLPHVFLEEDEERQVLEEIAALRERFAAVAARP